MNKIFGLLGITAIFAIVASTSYALPFADSVAGFQPGSNFGVEDGSPDTEPGTYYPDAVTGLDGVVLGLGGAVGTPGSITMRFTTGKVIDLAGPDLRIYDTYSFADGVSLDVSKDGSNFLHAFSFGGDLTVFSCSLMDPCAADVDISNAGLGAISYVRITTAGNSGQGDPSGFTLDAVEALNFRAFPVSEPGTLPLLFISAAALTAACRRKRIE